MTIHALLQGGYGKNVKFATSPKINLCLMVWMVSLFAPLLSKAQNYQTFGGSSSNTLTDNIWSSPSGTNACNYTGLSNGFTSGNIAYFCSSSSSSGTGSVAITVGGLVVTQNYTHTGGTNNTLETSGSVISVDVANAKTLTLPYNYLSNTSGTGFIKNGTGTWDLSGTGGSPYNGGFTLNTGTVKTTSANAFGSGPMVINGGTLQIIGVGLSGVSNVTIGGNFTIMGTGNVTCASSVSLGSAIRTISLNKETGNFIFSGNISGSGGLIKDGSTEMRLTGSNTYTGLTTVNGSHRLNIYGPNGTTLPSTNDIVLNSGYLAINSNQTLNNLTINGGILEVGTNKTLTINGTLTINNNVTISVAGTILITGSGTLALSSGKLTLGATNLILENGVAITGGSSSRYIVTNSTGYLQRNAITSSTDFPVGNSSYNPVTLNNSGNSDNFRVRVSDNVLVSGTTGSPLTSDAVNRTWTITEEVAGGSNVNLTMQWNGSSEELSSFDRNSCYVMHYSGGWSGTTAGTATGSNPFTISRSGITSFSPFGVGSGSTLPVKLINFDAQRINDNGQIRWSTANEINNDYFEVEKSTDGINFYAIAKIKGAGHSQQTLNYSYDDLNLANGTHYYRLKQTDYDGKFSYSHIEVISDSKTVKVKVYPVPATNILHIELNSQKGMETQCKIVTALGEIVFEKTINLISGHNPIEIDLTKFSKGVYFIHFDGNKENSTTRFLVK